MKTNFISCSDILRLLLILSITVGFATQANSSSQNKLDNTILQGKLNSVGSDTLANLVTYLGDEFVLLHPKVKLEIHAEGSSTAPPALISGQADIGPMSRLMSADEIALFEQTFGYSPTAIKVGIDALAVFVHRSNPVSGISLKQVDAIFSSTHYCSNEPGMNFWHQMGLEQPWRNRDIERYGRNSVSGSHAFFKQVALCNGEFREGLHELPGSGSVIQALSNNQNGIGFSGIGFKTSGVRTLPIILADGTKITPSVESVGNGNYPLSRFLYIYVNKHPDRPLPNISRAFLRMTLSEQGQKTIEQDGYIPLPEWMISRELSLLEN